MFLFGFVVVFRKRTIVPRFAKRILKRTGKYADTGVGDIIDPCWFHWRDTSTFFIFSTVADRK